MIRRSYVYLILLIVGIIGSAGLWTFLKSPISRLQYPPIELVITDYSQTGNTILIYSNHNHYTLDTDLDGSQFIQIGEMHKLTFTWRTLTGITVMEK